MVGCWSGVRSQAFSLWSEHDQVFDRSVRSGVRDPVSGAGVELNDFPGGEDEVMFVERQPQPSIENAQPFISLVG